MDSRLLMMMMVAGVGLVCLFLAFGPDKSKQAKRVERLKQRGQGVAPGEELQLRKDSGDRKRLDQMVRKLVPKPDALRQRLYRTGRPITLGTYGIICGVVAVVATGVAMFFGISLLLAPLLGALAGLWLPHLAIGYLGTRRANKFMTLFPDAIGLMVRGLKSGLPITETFQIVAQEIADPVGIEFRQVMDQVKLGNPVEQALLDAARRVGTPELKFLTVTLSIQRETGGNLAETLENLDSVLRRRRQMKLKIRAMSSEARASAMILGAMPFVVGGILMALNHSYIMILFTTTRGHHFLMFGATMLGVGSAIMAKMVRFEI